MLTDYKQVEAKIYNHTHWVNECTPVVLKETYEELLIKSGFTIISFSEHHFDKQGYTCFWFSCNQEKLEHFKNFIK